jgi:hypothetical protein
LIFALRPCGSKLVGNTTVARMAPSSKAKKDTRKGDRHAKNTEANNNRQSTERKAGQKRPASHSGRYKCGARKGSWAEDGHRLTNFKLMMQKSVGPSSIQGSKKVQASPNVEGLQGSLLRFQASSVQGSALQLPARDCQEQIQKQGKQALVARRQGSAASAVPKAPLSWGCWGGQ